MSVEATSTNTEINAGSTARDLEQDEVFEVLSNRRRRHVFHYLKREEREVYLRELADTLAAWEYEKEPETLNAQERKRVKTALQQHHLPKMAENGFVKYDSQRGTVRLSEAATNLEVYLDLVPGRDVPWGLHYLGLSSIGALLAAGATFDLYPISIVPDHTWLLFLSVTLLASAAVHTYYTYSQMRFGVSEEPPEVSER